MEERARKVFIKKFIRYTIVKSPTDYDEDSIQKTALKESEQVLFRRLEKLSEPELFNIVKSSSMVCIDTALECGYTSFAKRLFIDFKTEAYKNNVSEPFDPTKSTWVLTPYL